MRIKKCSSICYCNWIFHLIFFFKKFRYLKWRFVPKCVVIPFIHNITTIFSRWSYVVRASSPKYSSYAKFFPNCNANRLVGSGFWHWLPQWIRFLHNDSIRFGIQTTQSNRLALCNFSYRNAGCHWNESTIPSETNSSPYFLCSFSAQLNNCHANVLFLRLAIHKSARSTFPNIDSSRNYWRKISFGWFSWSVCPIIIGWPGTVVFLFKLPAGQPENWFFYLLNTTSFD